MIGFYIGAYVSGFVTAVCILIAMALYFNPDRFDDDE